MKRIALLMAAVILMLSLTGCIIIPRYKYFEIDGSTVSSIQIYDLCEYDGLGSDFLDSETAAHVIPKDENEAFLKDLARIRFSDALVIVLAAVDPSFYYDTWTVRINYTDGSYELISCDGYGEIFDEKGTRTDSHHYGCDNDEWRIFMGKYLPEDVFDHEHETERETASEPSDSAEPTTKSTA